jgi:hypothetical protein
MFKTVVTILGILTALLSITDSFAAPNAPSATAQTPVRYRTTTGRLTCLLNDAAIVGIFLPKQAHWQTAGNRRPGIPAGALTPAGADPLTVRFL